MGAAPERDEKICRILLIGGSLREGSVNTAVLKTARADAAANVEAILYERLGDLPLFNPDLDRDPLPEPVAHLRANLGVAGAILFSTPEYAGSLPGAFKNLLDWIVGGGLYGKTAGWINPSSHGGSGGTYETLRIVLGFTGAGIVEAACLKIPVQRADIGADGLVAAPDIRKAIGAALRALAVRAAGKGQ